MLCVVGGKLSEGINFSDDLGRYGMCIYSNLDKLSVMLYFLKQVHSDGGAAVSQPQVPRAQGENGLPQCQHG